MIITNGIDNVTRITNKITLVQNVSISVMSKFKLENEQLLVNICSSSRGAEGGDSLGEQTHEAEIDHLNKRRERGPVGPRGGGQGGVVGGDDLKMQFSTYIPMMH